MATRRDKEKVIDEVWDDARIRGFLERECRDADVDADFHRLLGAYQGMRIGDFRRFLVMFTDGGHDVDATDARGATVAEVIRPHRHATEFLEALAAHGARTPESSDATPIAQES